MLAGETRDEERGLCVEQVEMRKKWSIANWSFRLLEFVFVLSSYLLRGSLETIHFPQKVLIKSLK